MRRYEFIDYRLINPLRVQLDTIGIVKLILSLVHLHRRAPPTYRNDRADAGHIR